MTYRVAVRDPQGAKGEPANVATTMRADDPLVVELSFRGPHCWTWAPREDVCGGRASPVIGLPVPVGKVPRADMSNAAVVDGEADRAQRTQRRLWLSIFWVSFPFGILSFVLPIYGRDLGASALEIGALFSALALVPVIVRPFLGRVLDRWGRRPFLLLGLGGYLLAMLVFALADQVWILMLGRLIQGFGQALLWLTALTVVADTAGASSRGLSFGAIDEATNRGAIAGTTLGFAAIFSVGRGESSGLGQVWPMLLLAYSVPALIALFTAWQASRDASRRAAPSCCHPSPDSPVDDPDGNRLPDGRIGGDGLAAADGVPRGFAGGGDRRAGLRLPPGGGDRIGGAITRRATCRPLRATGADGRRPADRRPRLGVDPAPANGGLAGGPVGDRVHWLCRLRPGGTRLCRRYRRRGHSRRKLRAVHLRLLPGDGRRPARRRLVVRRHPAGLPLLSQQPLPHRRCSIGLGTARWRTRACQRTFSPQKDRETGADAGT